METIFCHYLLFYNEKTGAYRIDEVGKTLKAESDDADYKRVGGSNNLEELKNFVQSMTLISLSNDIGEVKWSHKSLVSYFENRFSKLIVRNFDSNDF
jgi:hypothetical protein